jgi:signal transduction histidine kinase
MPLPEEDLLRILEATRMITSTLRLSELLETVMRLASDVVKAEVSSLLLMDPATDELYFDIALGEKGGALQQIRLKKGEGIAGWVAQHQKPAVVNDVASDPRWTQKADDKTKFKTRSILAVPMLVREKLVGVMEVINRVGETHFTEVDVRLLETFAAQAAVAIENARLFESIRQEKEKMSTILGEMSEGALLLDAAGKILLGNPRATQLLDRGPLEGQLWAAMRETFTMQPGWEDIHTALGGAGGIELRRVKEPLLILSGVINQICNDKGQVTGYLIVVSDVTEERREAQMKKNFLALVSHKLKTPLVAIRGFVPMLLEKPEELNSFQKTALETIDRNSIALTDLVDKITWFTALEAERLELQKKPYQINQILDVALSDLAAFLKHNQAEVVRDDSLNRTGMLTVDKIWMKEAVRNLVENAVKFNKQTPKRIAVSAREASGSLELLFTDNGPGIPPEERTKIFQKFYQIEGSFTGQVQGMGLGLALVKRVAEAHGGTAHVESALGQGSTFILSLPIA